MLIIKTQQLLRQHIRFLRQKGKRIALVPTMGNLHNGHMKLVNEAKTRADIVVVSIFINPMQFEQAEDLARYPRTLQKDYYKLNKLQVDFVFSPTVKSIYPYGTEMITHVEVPGISTILEGASRIGHFRGVSTIISKLFNLVQPDIACFGEKDFQQLAIIRKMVIDLEYDIEIVSVPTVRTKNGLALSSRNSYLTTDQRKISPNLNKIINKIAKQIRSKTLTIKEIVIFAEQKLSKLGFRIDYLQIRDANTLLNLTKASQRAVILVAVWLGQTRLIDNKVVDLI